MAAILISHCERNLGRVKKPVGTGDPSSILLKARLFCSFDCFGDKGMPYHSDCNIYANAVN